MLVEQNVGTIGNPFCAISFYHYYEKHLLGRVKTHFLGRVARRLLVLAAKNTYLQGRVAKPPLKSFARPRRFDFETFNNVSRVFFAICIPVDFDH